MKKCYPLIFLLLLFLFTAPSNVSATTITGLYNTGVDVTGNALGQNITDPHYAFVTQPSPFGLTAQTVLDTAFPINDVSPLGPWVANNAFSRWIGPNTTAADGPPGSYTYRTTFTLPGDTILSSVLINGFWGTDDQNAVNDILINGFSTSPATTDFATLVAFSISSGFQLGMNELDFIVGNGPDPPTSGVNPTGLRVDLMTGTYETTTPPAIPEPSTMLLLGFGLIGLAGFRRKSN